MAKWYAAAIIAFWAVHLGVAVHRVAIKARFTLNNHDALTEAPSGVSSPAPPANAADARDAVQREALNTLETLIQRKLQQYKKAGVLQKYPEALDLKGPAPSSKLPPASPETVKSKQAIQAATEETGKLEGELLRDEAMISAISMR